MYQKTKDGIYYNPKYGRIVVHKGYSTRIFWSASMLDYLRRHFATTLNEELAGCLGVSQRTMIRKARELGLTKDEAWLHQVWEERRQLAHAVSKQKGHPGGFVKGVRVSPDTEFRKGHRSSSDIEAKRREGLRRWYRCNPGKASVKAMKAWETRRARKVSQKDDSKELVL
ncbi:MAG: hypothetical protein K6F74_05750 [Prevotella sp.]|nr:hypothetical protein [Prevotella sp.]